jgi:phosphatidylserine/phosphatidylglycerophosphate/cardiolipin synthase-like enzyme
VIDALLDVPPYVRERLASALKSGLISAPYSGASLRAVLAHGDGVDNILRTLIELDGLGISGAAAAELIRMIERVQARTSRPDLVWSGPDVPGLHARETRRVYEELLGSARRSVWASTYAFFDGPSAFEVLARRMDAVRDLRVTLLLNIERRRGDTTVTEQLVRRFTEKFWKLEWPGAAKPRLFYDPRALDREGPGGVLHAKAVVTDDEAVFVTSANLTEAALDRNIELGLLVRDRALAVSVVTHFQTLIDRGLLSPLPMA